MLCSKCNLQIPDKAKFCPCCGERVAQKNQSDQSVPLISSNKTVWKTYKRKSAKKVLLCAQCGHELRKGSQFCTRCGTPVQAIASETGVPTTIKTIKMPKWIFLSVLILSAIILIVVAIFVFHKDKPDTKQGNPSATVLIGATASPENNVLLDDILGTWDTVTGADNHYITILEGDSLVLTDGPDTVEVPYTCISSTSFSISCEGYIFTFEYTDEVLIRYEDGQKDGYTYRKRAQANASDISVSNTITSNSPLISITTQSPSAPPFIPEPTKRPSPIPSKTAPANIEYSITHLIQAIEVWTNYSNYGAACEFSDVYVSEEVRAHLSSEQNLWVSDLRLCKCCNSILEAKAHLEKYLDTNMYDNFSDNAFVQFQGRLYCALGGVGYIEYDTNITNSQIVRKAYDKISVIIKKYGSGGDFSCNTQIDFAYQNGSYKIVRVTDLV